MIHFSIAHASMQLAQIKEKFITLFEHGTMQLEYYKPQPTDEQQPHTKDEIYIIATGTAVFYCDGQTKNVTPGDFLFVPAGAQHRFQSFTNDFSTWVIFYGKDGGEKQ